VDYVREIIRRRHLTLDKPPLHVDHWPWPLKVYTMGRFELHQNGNSLQFSRKAQKKPLELLKTLIAAGGKEVSEEQVADLLWPEADGDAAYAAFKTNVSRLRHLLGNDRAIRFQDGRITLDAHSCWVDAWAFEHMVSESEGLWEHVSSKKNPSEALQLAEKALDLYRGHFLSSDGDTFWAVTYRERLRDKYLRLVTRIGEHHEKSSQWEEALNFFLNACLFFFGKVKGSNTAELYLPNQHPENIHVNLVLDKQVSLIEYQVGKTSPAPLSKNHILSSYLVTFIMLNFLLRCFSGRNYANSAVVIILFEKSMYSNQNIVGTVFASSNPSILARAMLLIIDGDC
jgi:hypothetical protein